MACGNACKTNDEIAKYWKPVLRWQTQYFAAQQQVVFETGITVPMARAVAHVGIETGYTGDPKIKSKGVNKCCPNPGTDCTPDCRAWGLFQIFWPTVKGVDFSQLFDPTYNSYVGFRMLAENFKTCGDWVGASSKFFSGDCNLNGTTDGSNGTSDTTYRAVMADNIAELQKIGVDDTSTDPKGQPKNGNGNTPTVDNTCFTIPGIDKTICPNQILTSNPLDILNPTIIEHTISRFTVVIIGVILLAIGAFVIIST